MDLSEIKIQADESNSNDEGVGGRSQLVDTVGEAPGRGWWGQS